MDSVVIALVIAAALFAGILFLYLIYCVWIRSNTNKVLTVAAFAFVSYSIFEAIFPSASFYREEFEHISGKGFPESGRFVYKTSTYPDIHGDYISCSIFKVSKQDLNQMRQYLQPVNNKKQFSCNKGEVFFVQLDNTPSVKRGDSRYWGVLNNDMVSAEHWHL